MKRKFLAEARDNWFEVCARPTNTLHPELKKLIQLASQGVTLDDLSKLKHDLLGDLRQFVKPASTKDRKRHSLGMVLQFIFDYPINRKKVSVNDVEFLFEFVWGGSIDKETDELKNEFLNVFGLETVRRLCQYMLNRHEYSLGRDGFTEEEMETLVRLLTASMLFLLHHHEISKDKLRLYVAPTKEGALWARLSQSASRGNQGGKVAKHSKRKEPNL